MVGPEILGAYAIFVKISLRKRNLRKFEDLFKKFGNLCLYKKI